MLKRIFMAALVGFCAFTSILPAQAQTGESKAAAGHHHGEWDSAKFQERQAKHEKKLHDLLHLTAAQEPAWQAFISKTRMTPPSPHEHHEKGADKPALTSPERMEKMLNHFKEMEARMQTHLTALKAFYAVLTPEQRTIFELAHRNGAGRGEHHRMGPGGHEGGMRGHQGPHHDGPPKGSAHPQSDASDNG